MRLFLAPHNDDETLFGAYTLLRDCPTVVTVLRSEVEADWSVPVTAKTREDETRGALEVLGCADDWQQWPFGDRDPDWNLIRLTLSTFKEKAALVFAPQWHPDGHPQHNMVSALAADVFGARVRYYQTYTRSGGKQCDGIEVLPERAWVPKKLAALACYVSQASNPATLPHFTRDLREYMAP